MSAQTAQHAPENSVRPVFPSSTPLHLHFGVSPFIEWEEVIGLYFAH